MECSENIDWVLLVSGGVELFCVLVGFLSSCSSITVREVLQCLTVMAGLLSSLFSSIIFCFASFVALLFGSYRVGQE